MENIKLIDCFPYFNEKELLELRIKLLYDHVDKFVITEANQTHSGLPKEYTCSEVLETIEDPLNKIELIQIDFSNNPEFDNWKRERVQRDSVLQILHKFDDDCLFYFGDCDEILNPNHIQWICNTAKQYPLNILRIPLAFLNCRADLRVFDQDDNPIPWKTSYIASKMHLRRYTPSQIRESSALSQNMQFSELGKSINFPDITLTCNNVEVILGWHFSWMGDNDQRKTKCRSYLHYNDKFEFTIAPINSNDMMDFMDGYTAKEGSTDPLGRSNHILRKYDLSLLPELILTDKKFKNYFLPEECETILELLEKNPEISTDKNSIKYFNKSLEWDFMQYHSYIDNFYNEEFKKYRGKSINLCEIGIDTGGSIAIWSKYFNTGNIIGIDSNTSRLKEEYQDTKFNNVKYIIQNAYDEILVNSLPNFDIIIDDGPHTFESQKDFIKLYSHKLNAGGVMVIEDVKSLDYINEFNSLLLPGFYSECIDLTVMDNLSDSILYIIRR